MIYGLMCPTSRLFAAAVLAASEVVLRPQDIDIAVMRNFMWNVGRMGRIQDSFQRISQISEDFTDFTNIGFDMFLGIDLPSRTAEGVSTVGPISLSSAKAPCRNAPRWHLQSPPSFTDMKIHKPWPSTWTKHIEKTSVLMQYGAVHWWVSKTDFKIFQDSNQVPTSASSWFKGYVCVCVPQVEWTSSREGGSNLISAKLPNKFYGTMMSTEAAAWRSLGLLAGKKTWDSMGWFKVAHGSWFHQKNNSWIVETCWNLEACRKYWWTNVNKHPSIFKDECYRSWFGLRIEKWLHWGPWLEPGPEQRPPYLVERTAGIDWYGKHQQTIVDIGKHWM